MFTMKGKHAAANIMIDNIDQTTRSQIQGFLNHPAFGGSYIAIMPDCHAGKGAVVGMTMKRNDYVIPNVIGVDIGCGMLMDRYSVVDLDLVAFDEYIKEHIPSGFKTHAGRGPIVYGNAERIDELEIACKDLGIAPERVFASIGTLGGGNHFIEVGRDKEGLIRVTIHSGSRYFGKTVAEFYQKKAKEKLKQYFVGDAFRDSEYVHKDDMIAQDYLYHMGLAQEYAERNRAAMSSIISGFFEMKPMQTIESIHNYINFEDDIIRKGAISAQSGEMCIIPFNMRDGIAICVGKGNPAYNFSAPHGAGRIMSRSQAKECIGVEDFVQGMKDAGVYTTTANKDTVDEAPDAYKDMQIILDNIHDTVDVLEIVKPLYNFKAGGD